MYSPLSPFFPDPEKIPEAFRIQFLHSPEFKHDVILEGELEEVWFRPIWLAPLFWFLELLGILIAERDQNIKTILKVVAKYDKKGNPYHLWYRRFLGSKIKKFDVKIVYDGVTKQAVDLVGPCRLLALTWRIKYLEPDTIKLDVTGAGLRFGDKYYWIPRWIWPFLLGREKFTQKLISTEENQVRIDLSIEHPFFGQVFCYRGVFNVRKTDTYVDGPPCLSAWENVSIHKY